MIENIPEIIKGIKQIKSLEVRTWVAAMAHTSLEERDIIDETTIPYHTWLNLCGIENDPLQAAFDKIISGLEVVEMQESSDRPFSDTKN